MRLAEFVKLATVLLEEKYPGQEAGAIVRELCSARLGLRPWSFVTEPDLQIDEKSLETDLRRLADCEPIQYVLGKAWFFGREFKVNPSVLIPRPETELLVQHALSFAGTLGRPPRVADLCTGSGCIAWSISKELPAAEVLAVDISEKALELARTQFPETGPRFIKADVLDNKELSLSVPGKFDIILSNPPYICEEEKEGMHANVLDHEPELALFVPDSDPLMFYRSVAEFARESLSKDGAGFVEINSRFGDETTRLFREKGFAQCSIINDLHSDPRIVFFRA